MQNVYRDDENSSISGKTICEVFNNDFLGLIDKINAAEGSIYLVGGAIRDSLLGRNNDDWDIVITGLNEPT